MALASDLDIESQGKTIGEALANLKEALELYFEDEDVIRPSLSDTPLISIIEASM